MTNELKLIFVLGIITLVLAGSLKVLNCLYNRSRSVKVYNHPRVNTDLLKSRASHEKYVKISRKTSIRNKQIRQSGDFMDFVLPHINSNGNIPENKLGFLDCGENYYEQ